MSFQPVVPFSGLSGWSFLNATMERQTESFSESPRITRDTAYFEKMISKVRSAEELVSDRRLLRVALGAFGLRDDLDNRHLIRKVLEEGTRERSALANRLADGRYKTLADAFGFAGPEAPRTQATGFGREIVEKFRAREFEEAVGAESESLRLAMNAQRDLLQIAESGDDETTKWLEILGTPPLREVFVTMLGLPDGFGQLDLDRQVEVLRDRTRSQLDLARLADLEDSARMDQLIERYLLQDQIAEINVQSSGAIALALLRPGEPETRF